MNMKTINHFYFGSFDPSMKNPDLVNCLGFYVFNVLDVTQSGEVTIRPLVGLWLHVHHGRVIIVYDEGNPPSVRAGFALDLHQAAVARVRDDARHIRKPVAFFINDDGKIGAVSLADFMRERVPAIVAGAPALARSGQPYQLAAFGALQPPAP